MKNHSLGDWSVGQTRAIFEYDEKQYDKELDELEQTALVEMRAGIADEVTGYVKEIYELQEDQMVSDRINSEVNDLSHLAEDDDFGERDFADYGD